MTDKINKWLHDNFVPFLAILLVAVFALSLLIPRSSDYNNALEKIEQLEAEVAELTETGGGRPIVVADQQLQERALALLEENEELKREIASLQSTNAGLRRTNAQLRADYNRIEVINTRLLNLIGGPEYKELRDKIHGYTDSERAGLTGLVDAYG